MIEGTPRLLNEARITAITDAVRKGLSVPRAAARAKISKRTLQLWRAAGNDRLSAAIEADPEYDPTTSDDLLVRLAFGIEQAEAEFIERHNDNIAEQALGADGGRPNWAASMTMLERRFPEEYGRQDRVRHEHEGKVLHGVVAIPAAEATEEEWERITGRKTVTATIIDRRDDDGDTGGEEDAPPV